MTDDTNTANPLFTNPLVYQLPYSGEVRQGISYGEAGRVFDIYLPEQSEAPAPAVVLVTGYPDPGFEARIGMKQMQIPVYKGWARLLAANGMAAVIYSNIQPVDDVLTLLGFLRSQAHQLQIDQIGRAHV